MGRQLRCIQSLPLILICVGAQINLAAQQSTGDYQVNRSAPTATATLPTQYDLSSLPEAPRERLLPLYRQEYGLLQQLREIGLQALSDVLMGIASSVGSATKSAAKSVNVTEESAASAGQYGARSGGVSAVGDAKRPRDDYESISRARDLLIRIDSLERQISAVNLLYGINPSTRSPWLQSIRGELTPAEVQGILQQAVVNSAKPVGAQQLGAPTCRSGNAIRACGRTYDACAHSCGDPHPDPGNIVYSSSWSACMDACDSSRKACIRGVESLPPCRY